MVIRGILFSYYTRIILQTVCCILLYPTNRHEPSYPLKHFVANRDNSQMLMIITSKFISSLSVYRKERRKPHTSAIYARILIVPSRILRGIKPCFTQLPRITNANYVGRSFVGREVTETIYSCIKVQGSSIALSAGKRSSLGTGEKQVFFEKYWEGKL